MTRNHLALALTALFLVACNGRRERSSSSGTALAPGVAPSSSSTPSGPTSAVSASVGTGALPAPAVGPLALTSITPPSGDLALETPVTLVGDGFVAGVRVFLGGREASSVVVLDSQTLTCRSPALPSGVHDVVVQRDADAVILPLAFQAVLAGTPDVRMGVGGTRYTPAVVPEEGLVLQFLEPTGGSRLLVMRRGPTRDEYALLRVAADGQVLQRVSLAQPGYGSTAVFDNQGRVVTAILESRNVARLRRFLDDGSVDPAYGASLITFPGVGLSSTLYLRGVVDAQGRLHLAARQDAGTTSRMMVARFTATGALDPTFGAGGVYVHATGAADRVVFPSVTLDAQGRVMLASLYQTNAGLARTGIVRLRLDGTADPTFGQGGEVLLPAIDLVTLADGLQGRTLLLVRQSADVISVRRLTAAGAPDATFGAGGETLLAGFGADLALDPRSGAIAVSGLSQGLEAAWILDPAGPLRSAHLRPRVGPATFLPWPRGLQFDVWGRVVVASTLGPPRASNLVTTYEGSVQWWIR